MTHNQVKIVKKLSLIDKIKRIFKSNKSKPSEKK